MPTVLATTRETLNVPVCLLDCRARIAVKSFRFETLDWLICVACFDALVSRDVLNLRFRLKFRCFKAVVFNIFVQSPPYRDFA